MRLALHILGTEVLAISTSADQPEVETEPGDATSNVIGFCASPGDQRWDVGAVLE